MTTQLAEQLLLSAAWERWKWLLRDMPWDWQNDRRRENLETYCIELCKGNNQAGVILAEIAMRLRMSP